jgi:hypothetical protein
LVLKQLLVESTATVIGKRMKTVQDLMEQGVLSTKLNILVFGPQVHTLCKSDGRTRKLQNKRIEIRVELEKLGHHVRYAEDIVDPSLSGPASNAMLQEIVIMKEYDFIVVLVDSPGSIAETTHITTNPPIAQKSSLFLDSDYSKGLVAETCRLGEINGAKLQTYQYPNDLTECNLLGFVKQRTQEIQTAKYLL